MKQILSFFFLFGFFNSTAQNYKGRVTDFQLLPIEQAYIINLKTGSHQHSEASGYFYLDDVEIGDSIKISHIGFESEVFVISNLNKTSTYKLTEKALSLDEINVAPELDAVNLFANINLKTNPVNSSQDILRKVPGLVIGQHAGGGKAEQIFLRGFDIDHGTDISISVDGMPVNMVSHAHGQGYADLHFVIPETVENLNYGKGPYYADYGNFSTAAFVNFRTKERPKNNEIKLEVGDFNSQRLLGVFNLLATEKHSAYLASEFVLTDGPYESPQNFSRNNWFGKYTGFLKNGDKLSISSSYFYSKWDASGQIPQRLVDDGTISRFGAVDDTEGGATSRSNIVLNYFKPIGDKTFIKNTAYYSNYNFDLYSNFTFFLEDSINGDQIHQHENRQLFGYTGELNRSFTRNNLETKLQAGVGIRSDFTQESALSHIKNRTEILERLQYGDISETNLFGYFNVSFEIGKWVLNPGLRIDNFKFVYNDLLSENYQTLSQTEAILSPKFNILYNYSDNLQLYLKTGKGFHSNDTRVVVAQNNLNHVPAAYGADLGFIWKPTPKLLVNTAYWYLLSEQEFVYVGDAGIVEPNGRTQRNGVDLSLRYQILTWLFTDADFTYSHARLMDEEEGSNLIPLAPDLVFSGGLSMVHPTGFYGGLQCRHLNNRPANEDNSIVAKGYTVFDFNLGYQLKRLDFRINIQNLLNTEWNETQFATESRLQKEAHSIEEIHFTPGTPLFFKASVAYKF